MDPVSVASTILSRAGVELLVEESSYRGVMCSWLRVDHNDCTIRLRRPHTARTPVAELLQVIAEIQSARVGADTDKEHRNAMEAIHRRLAMFLRPDLYYSLPGTVRPVLERAL